MQLSLFDDKNMLLNMGTSALITLDLDEAEKNFRLYKKRYRGYGEVDEKLSITDFLRKGVEGVSSSSADEPLHLYRMWLSFEKYVKAEGFETSDLIGKIKKSFFALIVETIDRWGIPDKAFLCGDVPVGRLFIEAGLHDRAVNSLQTALLASPDKAAMLYGYLGDAYAAQGDLAVARKCYFEACLAAPQMLDWQQIRDGALAALKKALEKNHGMTASVAAEWVASYACIEGIFQPKTIRLKDELKPFVDSYLALERAYKKRGNAVIKPRLFIRAIILCDNEEMLKRVKGVDFIKARTRMKELDPPLFNRYMHSIRSRQTEHK